MRNFLSILFLFFVGTYAFGQKHYMMGLPPDDGRYNKLPRKAGLLTRSYVSLPAKHSLFAYCPIARSQGNHGTCSSWATGYAARTIAEAVKYGWPDQNQVSSEAFSPLFVYTMIKQREDSDCQYGVYINEALELMKTKGVSKMASFDVPCADYVRDDIKNAARQHTIDDYSTLFDMFCDNPAEKITKVKKSLCEDRPVVIAMHIPHSFFDTGGNWNGTSDIDPSQHGYHALCVIGYDNYVDGGAFQIMNSWGDYWGDNGFVWVKYDDFAKYVDQAYEVYVKKEAPKPSPSPQKYTMDGEMMIASHNGTNNMPVLFTENGELPHYATLEDYLSGTKFRLYMNNHEPAWVYIIASDLNNEVSKLFPYDNIVSAYMNYSENNFAIPDEQHDFEFDNTAGTDYFCVLYSQEQLDIDNIVWQIKRSNGTFYQKLQAVLGDKMASLEDVRYIQNYMGFSAKTNKSIVPLVVEISHKDISVRY